MNWGIDKATGTLLTPDGPIQLLDAYSQWVFGAGRAFAPGHFLRKEAPEDFDFAALPGTTFAETKIFTIRASRAKTPKPYASVLGGLPLRSRSVASGPWPAPKMPKLANPEKLVITGVIDDGVNVFHDRFQSPSGSRVDFAWIQDADAKGGVPFGAELTGREITTAKTRSGQSDRALMKRFGLTGDRGNVYRPSLLDGPVSHGTLVTDLAAGASPTNAMAENHRLITVQLPTLGTLDTSGTTLIAAVELGIAYIYDRALALSQRLKTQIPVVINFSYGLSAGSRTGRSYLERKMRAASLQYRQATAHLVKGAAMGAATFRCLPAGNNALTRGHAQALAAGDDLSLPTRLLPDDQTASFVEFWVPGDARTAKIAITPPGERTRTLSWRNLHRTTFPATAYILTARNGDVLARVSLDDPHTGGAGSAPRWRILVAFAPTTRINGRTGVAAGLWELTASCNSKAAPLLAWVQRDDALDDLGPRGRQPYIDDPDYPRFAPDGRIAVDAIQNRTGPALRNGTISGLVGNAPLPNEPPGAYLDTISVTGVEWVNSACAVYAGAAATTDDAPPVAALAGTSHVTTGVLGAGTLSGTTATLNGTSVAAPQIARLIAEHLQGLDSDARQRFDALSWLATLGMAPARPTPQHPERAYQPGIREERLAPHGRIIGTNASDPRGVIQR